MLNAALVQPGLLELLVRAVVAFGQIIVDFVGGFGVGHRFLENIRGKDKNWGNGQRR
jgi:hypothetical protein